MLAASGSFSLEACAIASSPLYHCVSPALTCAHTCPSPSLSIHGRLDPTQRNHIKAVRRRCMWPVRLSSFQSASYPSSHRAYLAEFVLQCTYCTQTFCTSHFRPQAHHCSNPPPDRIAPPCPLCTSPFSVKLGEDLNNAMERHFNDSCVIMGGKKTQTPRCARSNCTKVLHVPIQCEVRGDVAYNGTWTNAVC